MLLLVEIDINRKNTLREGGMEDGKVEWRTGRWNGESTKLSFHLDIYFIFYLIVVKV
jgi:hypothetical protein